MQFVVAAVGRIRDPALAAAITEYETRAGRYWPLEAHAVREERGGAIPPDVVMQRESERLLSSVPAGAQLVACDVGGRSLSSVDFAGWLQRSREEARSVVFLIGGAFGLSAEVLTASAFRLSLSPFTLPHDLARLVLAEQLYRAGTIVRGEPYHK